MNWLNLEIRDLRSPNYIGSAPAERATWINILAYCCEQENGGVMAGARKWKDRQFQQLCGVTRREVDRADKLLTWHGDDLHVTSYPKTKEAEVRAKREAGREGGRRSGEARSLKTPPEMASTASSTASSTPQQGASTEGKEKGIGKEGEGNLPEEPTTAFSKPVNGKIREGETKDRIPTTPQSIRFAKLFHRKLTTGWTDNEITAYKKIGTLPEDDLAALERYYAANWPPRSDVNILRHDLVTLFNNISGEIGRAHAALEKPKAAASRLVTV